MIEIGSKAFEPCDERSSMWAQFVGSGRTAAAAATTTTTARDTAFEVRGTGALPRESRARTGRCPATVTGAATMWLCAAFHVCWVVRTETCGGGATTVAAISSVDTDARDAVDGTWPVDGSEGCCRKGEKSKRRNKKSHCDGRTGLTMQTRKTERLVLTFISL